ncbi:MAG: hypothetical protein ACYTXC_28605 [Nostoc sp.]
MRQTDDNSFFYEWVDDLPELNQQEQAGITQIKQRYDYHRLDGLLLEGTMLLLGLYCTQQRSTIYPNTLGLAPKTLN